MSSKYRQRQSEIADCIERVVAECESRTAVEFVVVFAGKSGSYRDVNMLAGLLFAVLSILFIVFAPFRFSPWGLPLDLAVSFLLGWAISKLSPKVRRLLSSSKRRAEQVRAGAESALVRQGVFHTKDRTGLLIYVSWFERRAEVIADVGVQRSVPRPEWNLAVADLQASSFSKEFPESFASSMKKMAELLERNLPPVGENPNEIPNRPVML